MGCARLLDITRLVSRAGLPPTGVDRVEFAYLDGFLRDGGAGVWGSRGPLWGSCCSTTRG